MTKFTAPGYIEEEGALISRRQLRRKLQASRAAAASLSLWSERDGTRFDRGAEGLLGVAAGTVAILVVKVLMLWGTLQAIS